MILLMSILGCFLIIQLKKKPKEKYGVIKLEEAKTKESALWQLSICVNAQT